MAVTIDKLLGRPLSHTHQVSDIIGYSAGSGDVTSVITVTTNTTLDTDNTILVNAASGNITITLPAAASKANKIYRIKKIDATVNTVIIQPQVSEMIDDNTNMILLFQDSSIDLVSNAANWYII